MQLINLTGVGDKTLSVLNAHEINTVSDLLHYYPRTYRTYHARTTKELVEGEWVTLSGTLARPVSHHAGRVSTQVSTFRDNVGSLTLRWFNSPFITRSVRPGSIYQVRGRVEVFNNRPQIVNPELKTLRTDHCVLHTEIIPIYTPLGTLKSGHIRNLIKSALTHNLPDPLPNNIRDKYSLLDLPHALNSIHFPPSRITLEGAIHRLAFDELLELQKSARSSAEHNQLPATPIACDTVSLCHWQENLPFTLTPSQSQVISEITADLQNPIAMHRLLAGEVGSGKTVVAAASALATGLAGHRTLLMAPTQILAEQLYSSFSQLLPKDIRISLVTGNTKGALDADIIVGTHALLSQLSKIDSIGLVIIDEQHRFGVAQREQLSLQIPAPHLLMMTATPIPRTLALTLFSNLSISRLDEMPKNRLPVKTYYVDDAKRSSAYSWIKSEINNNHNQAFVVVPLIELAENNEETPTKSIKEFESSLHTHFPGITIDFMHGKMKPTEKTAKINAFRSGATQILVATSMIEVGVDIPAANIMVIENSEFFGLATLHQLRGRIGRGGGQGHCLLFSSNLTSKVKERLSFFIKENNGAKLAEYDLHTRGPGELFGETQHGFFNLKLASIYDEQLLRETAEAVKMLPI